MLWMGICYLTMFIFTVTMRSHRHGFLVWNTSIFMEIFLQHKWCDRKTCDDKVLPWRRVSEWAWSSKYWVHKIARPDIRPTSIRLWLSRGCNVYMECLETTNAKNNTPTYLPINRHIILSSLKICTYSTRCHAVDQWLSKFFLFLCMISWVCKI